MIRHLKSRSLIPAALLLALCPLMQHDGGLVSKERRVYEHFLLDLFDSLPGSGRETEIEPGHFAGINPGRKTEIDHGREAGIEPGRDAEIDHGREAEIDPGRVAVTEREFGDGPEFAGLREYLMTMDPETRRIPPKAALRNALFIQEESRSGRLKAAGLFRWEEIPSNTGGRTRTIMYDPNDPDHRKVWAGAVTGGLWYRNDINDGGNWIAVGDFWPGLSVSCMAYDPNDPRTFYVGTGEGQTAVIIYRESSGLGTGIWKSPDAGTSWNLLASSEDLGYITDIAVRNESGRSVVYAAAVSGIYEGTTHPEQSRDGLYRSQDGGETWAQVLPEIPGENKPFSPAQIEISAGGRIFVGTMRNLDQKGGGRILYSDNGVDWTVVDRFVPQIMSRSSNNIPGRVILACAPSDPSVVYAILAGGDTDVLNGFVYSRGVLIIKSLNGGESWETVNMPPPHKGEAEGEWSFLAWHALTAAVQPDDPDVVWVGGLDLYRSDDGGGTWEQKTLWWNFGESYDPEYPVYVHADQHSLVFRPGSSTDLLNSNDGGVFTTVDAKAAAPQFEERNQGYNTLQYYTCAIHPDPGHRYFLGGCQDNGTFRTTTRPTSKEGSVSYGDGAYCFIDRDEPNIQISSSQFNYYYYSTDGMHGKVRYFDFPGGTFINPVDYDFIDNVLYANGMTFEGTYRDMIFRIRLLNDTVLSAVQVPANTGSVVPFSAIHILPWKEKGNTVVFAGTESGRLFRLDHAQALISSTEIGGSHFPAGYISCIETGSTADRILVTFSNYGVGHVWETMDGGGNWKDKSGNLPDMPVRWAIYPPGLPGSVMLATELGVWYTTDIEADPVKWRKSGGGFPNVRVDMLRSREADHHILAATHGRGLFLGTIPSGTGTGRLSAPGLNLDLYPNPATEEIKVLIRSTANGLWTLGIYDQAGRLRHAYRVRKQDYEMPCRISLEGLPPGSYILVARSGENYHSTPFIKKE